MNFRAEIQRRMKEREVTAYRLSQETGIAEAQLSRFFGGDGTRGLSIPALIKVLDCLGLELKLVEKEKEPL